MCACVLCGCVRACSCVHARACIRADLARVHAVEVGRLATDVYHGGMGARSCVCHALEPRVGNCYWKAAVLVCSARQGAPRARGLRLLRRCHESSGFAWWHAV